MKEIILPKKVKTELIRLGNPHDGGYAIEIGTLERVDALYSYGVGNNLTFEVDFWNKTQKPVFIFDHTVDDPKIPNLIFKKEGLAAIPKEGYNNFINCNKHKNVLLKMDIEGSEVNWIKETNFNLPVDTLIIEFHNLPQDLPFIQKIKEHYNIVWIHGNNAGKIIDGFPTILEVTFVKKSLNIFNGCAKNKYPLKIDSPNLPQSDDLEIDFRPFFI